MLLYSRRQIYVMSLLLDGANENASNCLPEETPDRRHDVRYTPVQQASPVPLHVDWLFRVHRGVIMMVGCRLGHCNCLVRSHGKYFDWAMEIHSNHVHVK